MIEATYMNDKCSLKSGFVQKLYVNLIKVTYFQNFKLISYLRTNFRQKLKSKIDQKLNQK